MMNPKFENKELEAKWDRILKLKEETAKVLEEARAQKLIGQSLNAKVVFTANGDDYKFLKENEELLKLVFIVSGLEIREGSYNIKVELADGQKCERCWKYSPTVGLSKLNPCVCADCAKVLEN